MKDRRKENTGKERKKRGVENVKKKKRVKQ
jgi:hypothetical protein